MRTADDISEADIRAALKEDMKAKCYFMGAVPDDASTKAYKLLEDNLSAFFNPKERLDFSFEKKYSKVLFG